MTEDPADRLMALIEAVVAADPSAISPVGAAILAALQLNMAQDSRSFARQLDLAHALVLRECAVLQHDLGLIEVTRRDARTQRLYYRASPQGAALLAIANPAQG